MWPPLAGRLAANHALVVPDLRGMGLSSPPAGGYDKWTQTGDIRAVLDKLGIGHAVVIGHDIGTMVAFACASRYPDKTNRLVVMDAPVPRMPPWEQIVPNPLLWHFSFGGPDAERLVTGRERIYLDRFRNEFAGDRKKVDEATPHLKRVDEATHTYYAKRYARPGARHPAFAQFLSFPKDAETNQKVVDHKLPMPVLAIGGAKSFGVNEALVMRNAATNVSEEVVPDAGHWLMEEAPEALTSALRSSSTENKKARRVAGFVGRGRAIRDQSQFSAPPVWYSVTRVSKKLRSFFRSIISLIHGNGFSSFGNSASRPIWTARRFAMKRR